LFGNEIKNKDMSMFTKYNEHIKRGRKKGTDQKTDKERIIKPTAIQKQKFKESKKKT